MLKLLKLFEMETGQTMVEYGLLVALVSVAVLVTLGFTGGYIQAFFMKVSDCIDSNPATVC